jgi:hypothetical protein
MSIDGLAVTMLHPDPISPLKVLDLGTGNKVRNVFRDLCRLDSSVLP